MMYEYKLQNSHICARALKLIKNNPLGAIIKNVSSIFCVVNGSKNVSKTVFNEIFIVLDTIFYRKSLELTKNYHQKLITPNGLY